MLIMKPMICKRVRVSHTMDQACGVGEFTEGYACVCPQDHGSQTSTLRVSRTESLAHKELQQEPLSQQSCWSFSHGSSSSNPPSNLISFCLPSSCQDYRNLLTTELLGFQHYFTLYSFDLHNNLAKRVAGAAFLILQMEQERPWEVRGRLGKQVAQRGLTTPPLLPFPSVSRYFLAAPLVSHKEGQHSS